MRFQHAFVTSISTMFDRKKTIQELQQDIDALHKEREILVTENNMLRGLLHYADETKELRTFNKKYNNKGIITQILVRHCSTDSQFFFVDAGSSQGVEKDMVAIYCNGIVGKVIEVYPWYCKICLITDSNCKIAAVCLPSHIKKEYRSSTQGIHEGMNAQYTALRYVSHLEKVNVGDKVFSSGQGLIFPQGFALGTIVAAEKEGLFYTITIDPSVNVQKLEYCMLIAREIQ